ncbi:unnamed protein product [Amoebophrya sp. A120]|nr:unnamed protein product [Amoebophrya sp. A120]|eukprot:GSA120T00016326001.1
MNWRTRSWDKTATSKMTPPQRQALLTSKMSRPCAPVGRQHRFGFQVEATSKCASASVVVFVFLLWQLVLPISTFLPGVVLIHENTWFHTGAAAATARRHQQHQQKIRRRSDEEGGGVIANKQHDYLWEATGCCCIEGNGRRHCLLPQNSNDTSCKLPDNISQEAAKAIDPQLLLQNDICAAIYAKYQDTPDGKDIVVRLNKPDSCCCRVNTVRGEPGLRCRPVDEKCYAEGVSLLKKTELANVLELPPSETDAKHRSDWINHIPEDLDRHFICLKDRNGELQGLVMDHDDHRLATQVLDMHKEKLLQEAVKKEQDALADRNAVVPDSELFFAQFLLADYLLPLLDRNKHLAIDDNTVQLALELATLVEEVLKSDLFRRRKEGDPEDDPDQEEDWSERFQKFLEDNKAKYVELDVLSPRTDFRRTYSDANADPISAQTDGIDDPLIMTPSMLFRKRFQEIPLPVLIALVLEFLAQCEMFANLPWRRETTGVQLLKVLEDVTTLEKIQHEERSLVDQINMFEASDLPALDKERDLELREDQYGEIQNEDLPLRVKRLQTAVRADLHRMEARDDVKFPPMLKLITDMLYKAFRKEWDYDLQQNVTIFEPRNPWLVFYDRLKKHFQDPVGENAWQRYFSHRHPIGNRQSADLALEMLAKGRAVLEEKKDDVAEQQAEGSNSNPDENQQHEFADAETGKEKSKVPAEVIALGMLFAVQVLQFRGLPWSRATLAAFKKVKRDERRLERQVSHRAAADDVLKTETALRVDSEVFTLFYMRDLTKIKAGDLYQDKPLPPYVFQNVGSEEFDAFAKDLTETLYNKDEGWVQRVPSPLLASCCCDAEDLIEPCKPGKCRSATSSTSSASRTMNSSVVHDQEDKNETGQTTTSASMKNATDSICMARKSANTGKIAHYRHYADLQNLVSCSGCYDDVEVLKITKKRTPITLVDVAPKGNDTLSRQAQKHLKDIDPEKEHDGDDIMAQQVKLCRLTEPSSLGAFERDAVCEPMHRYAYADVAKNLFLFPSYKTVYRKLNLDQLEPDDRKTVDRAISYVQYCCCPTHQAAGYYEFHYGCSKLSEEGCLQYDRVLFDTPGAQNRSDQHPTVNTCLKHMGEDRYERSGSLTPAELRALLKITRPAKDGSRAGVLDSADASAFLETDNSDRISSASLFAEEAAAFDAINNAERSGGHQEMKIKTTDDAIV